MNDIQQSQQLVDHRETFVKASCFQLLPAATLLLGRQHLLVLTSTEREKCDVPNHSVKIVESCLRGRENILLPSH